MDSSKHSFSPIAVILIISSANRHATFSIPMTVKATFTTTSIYIFVYHSTALPRCQSRQSFFALYSILAATSTTLSGQHCLPIALPFRSILSISSFFPLFKHATPTMLLKHRFTLLASLFYTKLSLPCFHLVHCLPSATLH